jgi:hypothetical protein
MAGKGKIRETLDKAGKVAVTIGSTTVTIERRDDRYEISVKEKDAAPSQWLYRSKTIAIDRFEEQVSHYRRKKQ